MHLSVGKASFGNEKLKENIEALIDAVKKAKPSAAKGKYFRSVTITTTMGPGIAIDETKIM